MGRSHLWLAVVNLAMLMVLGRKHSSSTRECRPPSLSARPLARLSRLSAPLGVRAWQLRFGPWS